ncbi:DeoR/GlpR family DNA-binding transcription regulator [Serinibacter arcticus]|uniref:Glycerol-3-phosphate regulon repressor, DeoR family n=1 Tax=Serinibacter arcticus TaxID=1655435 RepID=A0A4Z1E1M9_9MICO|nr:DeoR/GlpR family DNA-binding transcription regulator [Serinibacter arcticus]TGO05139.1 Glycerol-3-phosphate regulon repressor, DeoR family [Serinibacter arcticus]
MKIEDRHLSIASWVAQQGTISVEQVIEQFGVSPATARRDLDALAHQMVVIRTRGGARAAPISGDLPLRYRAALMSHEKLAIARAATAMVKPGQTVAFSGGTTTTQIAQELGVRASSDPEFAEKVTTVVTNAINIANDLIVRPELRVVLTGGAAIARSYELVGPLAKAALPLINVDVFFLGVNAINPARGFFTEFEAEAEISAAILEKSVQSYVVADHTKFASTAFALICKPTDVAGVITDSEADDESVAQLRAAGCPVVLA